jgi:CRP-like cAMP-binding protein
VAEQQQSRRVEERAEAIAAVDFLAALPADARHRLAELAETRLYGEGEDIIRQGHAGEELFVVEQGEVSVLLDRGSGAEVEVAKLGPGKFFGEMSLVTGEPRRATVRARTECEVLVVGKAAFHQIVASNDRLLERISQVLADRGGELEHVAINEASDDLGERRSQQLLLSRIKRFFSM